MEFPLSRVFIFLQYTVIVDAVLGVGLSREITGSLKEVIQGTFISFAGK